MKHSFHHRDTETRRYPLLRTLCLCVSVVLFLSGCIFHQPLPKDALVRGVSSKIVTPWGTSEQKIEEAATGAAANKAAGLK